MLALRERGLDKANRRVVRVALRHIAHVKHWMVLQRTRTTAARNSTKRPRAPALFTGARDSCDAWPYAEFCPSRFHTTGGGHFSRPAVADGIRSSRPVSRSLDHAGRAPGEGSLSSAPLGGNCLALHAVGFAVPLASPRERWALTPPFHPCLIPRLSSRAIGGLFSVALSLTPSLARTPIARREVCPGRVGVTHHRVLPCSDVPRRPIARPPRPPHHAGRTIIGSTDVPLTTLPS